MTKLKNKPFSFTFGHLIRLTIFISVVYLLINFLSQNKSNTISNSNILGQQVTNGLHSIISLETQQKINNISDLPIILDIKKQLNGFPTKQIDELKIEIIKKVSQDLINNIATPSITP